MKTQDIMEALEDALEADDIVTYNEIKEAYGVQELWEVEEEKKLNL